MAGVGRPPKLSVVNNKNFTKTEKKQREIAESKLRVARDLKPPKWLDRGAVTEFKRIVKESEPLGIIDNMDLTFLAIYCDAYSQYVKICEEMKELSIVDNFDGTTIVNNTRVELLKMLEKYKSIIMQSSNKLGLATSDRLRLVIPKGEEKPDNPFLQFL